VDATYILHLKIDEWRTILLIDAVFITVRKKKPTRY